MSLIEIDTSGALKELEKVKETLQQIPKGIEKATLRSMQKTARGIRTDATKVVTEEYNVRAKDIREKFCMEKRYSRTTGDFSLAVKAKSSRSVPITNFNPRYEEIEKEYSYTYYGKHKRTAKVKLNQVKVKIKRSSGLQKMKSAFPAKVGRGGHKAVFTRFGEKRRMTQGNYVGHYKQPIKEVKTTAPLRALHDDANAERVMDLATERFEKNMSHEIDYILKKEGLR